ncbi:MAG: AI-2E family transporter [Bacteroidales bacterium]|nr:AI-2E family transporter [Bacteroidales bacterium]
MEERNVDKLAGYIIKLGGLAIIAAICWYFRSILVYIAVAVVISLIGRPILKVLRKVTIKGKHAPEWLLAILTILAIFVLLSLIITQMVPLVTSIVRDASSMNVQSFLDSNPIGRLNEWLITMFPELGEDFNIVAVVMTKLRDVVNFSNVSGIVGSVVSSVSGFAVGAFAVLFMSYFFLKDASLLERILCALVPDKVEATLSTTLNDIKQLLSRYFVGLVIETLGVALIDFLGLWLIARIDVSYALGVAFLAGMLNMIPYVGPLMGEVLGVVICVILKLGTGAGLDVGIWVFALIVLAIMLTAQLIDNFIYQPVIYSTSIKAHPLEIFVVLLMAGHIGGAVGMLVAIPVYTVIRVIAIRFFYRFKPIQRLHPDLSDEDSLIEN